MCISDQGDEKENYSSMKPIQTTDEHAVADQSTVRIRGMFLESII